jgi:RNA polymerase sigma-70 factor, ECF subfamily
MNQPEPFAELRPLLFSIAYRMLGSIAEAEDILQEAFLRWQAASGVESPRAYLSAVVTRLCIDHLRSARVRRETYVGPWLPEPLVGEAGPGPDQAAALADSLSTAFLLLLETLGPAERAAFLLREVFDYEYEQIAAIVGKSETNCRQMVTRARQRLAERRPRFLASREDHERLTLQFLQSCASGDLSGLVSILAEDVELRSDGGGKTTAARRVLRGQDRVLRFLSGILRKAPPGLQARPVEVNGRLGLLSLVDGQPQSVLTLEVADGRIQAVYIVVNPDKLRRVAWP